jgi:hypothetical protein
MRNRQHSLEGLSIVRTDAYRLRTQDKCWNRVPMVVLVQCGKDFMLSVGAGNPKR